MGAPSGDDDDVGQMLAEATFIFRSETWRERAQCRIERVPTAEFFPVRGDSQKTAKECCARCDVRAECQDFADRSGTEWGIWGGEIRRRGPWPFVEQDYWSDIRSSVPQQVDYDLD